ncbi:hypothetical protein PC111_g18286 [Phytophthora cactorum]|uniref:Uncharacterized protein n=1 Tax=Phytophthora cactorum TaxID=29920 RepID=A0A8T1B4V7_9STRA|nr:hypothetical protein PC112_g19863 [Phytophthora cactorum]KAG2804370.1 hypothetical protein PC111_g18286 [Phytophthora cactorum]KAG2882704.1 hypothetical protein PC114_g20883 [Phytophthora cactorum]KAG2893179.1 hypothetical protein PC115_g18559 [Phytophthora cactorum]KAG2999090.1 hypothetical protein PC120_g20996 [Phytophthora cactorum]
MARVVSCRYMRISCSEDDHPLFRRYYARSNRERGVKPSRGIPLWPMNLANGEAMDEKNEHRSRPGEVVSLPEPRTPGRRRRASGFAQTEKASRSRLTSRF